jgi:hypothetical protein
LSARAAVGNGAGTGGAADAARVGRGAGAGTAGFAAVGVPADAGGWLNEADGDEDAASGTNTGGADASADVSPAGAVCSGVGVAEVEDDAGVSVAGALDSPLVAAPAGGADCDPDCERANSQMTMTAATLARSSSIRRRALRIRAAAVADPAASARAAAGGDMAASVRAAGVGEIAALVRAGLKARSSTNNGDGAISRA